MKFTDLFVNRPVLAVVVSLLILIIGIVSLRSLPMQEFPKTENSAITITTTYSGADPDLVAGFITSPLEQAIAQANGIDYVTSSSQSSSSVITAKLRLNYDADRALTEISSKVNSVLNQLPAGTLPPVLAVQGGDVGPSLYFGFTSDAMSLNQITDYLARIVQPRLQAVPGVQTSELIGARNFALRVWLDPERLVEYGLTPQDVSQALTDNNYLAGIGNTKSTTVQGVLSAATGLHEVVDFESLVVKHAGDAVVRLKNVARVALGSDVYDSHDRINGKEAVFIGIKIAPTANLLRVLNGVKTSFLELQPKFPPGLKGYIGYDASDFVNSAIGEVEHALFESALIVTVVVFVFLGSFRSVIIPTVTIPLSLIGTFAIIFFLGFSINLLTLLALVLAVGLVVDDAIIVVENVNRHLEDGKGLTEAARRTGRELGGPIIAMTVVLIAVYLPIGLQGGLTGALFTEFAFTLVGAVTVSAIVALTLSPMMCARLLRAQDSGAKAKAGLAAIVNHLFEALQRRYLTVLRGSLNFVPITVALLAVTFVGIYFLYSKAKSELAPPEDQGLIISIAMAPPNITVEQKEIYQRQIYERLAKFPEMTSVWQINSPGTAWSGMVLKPWDQRKRTSQEMELPLHQEMRGIAGVQVASFQLAPLPGGEGMPVQFVLGTAQPFLDLSKVSKRFLHAASQSGLFTYLDDDLKIDLPESTVIIDRDKVAALNLKVSDVGGALSTLLSGAYVNYFDLNGRSYKVIPQVQQRFRLNSRQLLNYYIPLPDGTPVSLASIATVRERVMPESLNHFQQMNASTVQGVLAPGVALGDALQYLKDLATRLLPSGYSIDYAGSSRQYMNESSGFAAMFALACVIIFLSLAALFESFRDPVIILISVPMSIIGALVFISLGVGGATLNIYTQIGLVTLMGLISKHGILIVQFANHLRATGMSRREAIEHAAAVRLRPILMTSAAMVLGVTPLVFAAGAFSVSRFNIGVVVASGISIGTLFTLFVVPAVYLMVSLPEQAVRVSPTADLDFSSPIVSVGENVSQNSQRLG